MLSNKVRNKRLNFNNYENLIHIRKGELNKQMFRLLRKYFNLLLDGNRQEEETKRYQAMCIDFLKPNLN